MSIACALVMVCAVCADQAMIQGGSNKIEVQISGATLTLQSDTQQGDPTDWNTSYVAADLLTEAVTLAVDNRIDVCVQIIF